MSAIRPTLAELLAAYAIDAPALTIGNLTLSSAAVVPGDVFLATQGARAHGLDFAQQAIAQGAVAILFEPIEGRAAPQLDVPTIAVPSLAERAGVLADAFYDRPSLTLKVIGVTGTNGKTSTVQLVAEALSALGYASATQGTLGAGPVGALVAGSYTTPDAVQTQRWLAAMREQGITHVAMEVSSHALTQHRVAGVRFHTAVYTNLSRDHLDYHGTMEAYFAAKALLFRWPELKCAVINRDDAYGAKLRATATTVLSYGFANPDVVLRGEGLSTSSEGLSFKTHTPWGSARFDTQLLGRFNASNLLAVIATLAGIGVPFDDIRRVVPMLLPVHGRMTRYGGGTLPLIVVDYAHTPDALEKALEALRAHCSGRLKVLFGCGGNRDRGKRPMMARVAEQLADEIWVTDDNPRDEDGDVIVAEIMDGFSDPTCVRVLRDRAQAITRLLTSAYAGDVLLIAGKGHEPYQEVRGVRHSFDDHALVRATLAAMDLDADDAQVVAA